ncbi:hypothetical protein BaRGS_00000649 [Batillaria attramentaria]|uniref:Transposase n=1 Tax=Batillaria attramentaria TaxID=370345 RepID=A0ABD0MAF4_9CAEN
MFLDESTLTHESTGRARVAESLRTKLPSWTLAGCYTRRLSGNHREHWLTEIDASTTTETISIVSKSPTPLARPECVRKCNIYLKKHVIT